MAKYDFGGGCACGLYRICNCGTGQMDGSMPAVVVNDNRPHLEAPAQARAFYINDLVRYFHGKSAGNGWWPDSMRSNPLVVSNKLALIHSEISEAMEETERTPWTTNCLIER